MRNFESVEKVVIKVGTNVLTRPGAVGIDSAYITRITRQIAELRRTGRQVVVISSGAIGMGAGQLALASRVKDIKMRQACAAIGQPLLMAAYRKAFARYGVTIAQVLLTAEVLNNRRTYLNLRNSIEKLLELGAVPVLNENDSVSTDEIGSAFGDNDNLSALVASKIDADLLIMLSDIDALYDKDPRKFPHAEPVPTVYEITPQLVRTAGGAAGARGTGGMKSKLEAAKIAASAGCRIVLADGRAKDIIARIMAGEEIGTIFMPRRKLSNRARWILNSSPAGTIRIDEGAMRAVRNRKSLLPSGIVSVDGAFEAGKVVMLNDNAKAVSSFSSAELKQLAGKHSSQICRILGPDRRDVVAIPEDIVIIDY
ncbi:MAG: glutamate 5-kinase [Planctomycetota bacterium]|jgi:glutamate 5-kinase